MFQLDRVISSLAHDRPQVMHLLAPLHLRKNVAEISSMVERTSSNPTIIHSSLIQMRLEQFHEHIADFTRLRIVEIDDRLLSAKYANYIDAILAAGMAGNDSIDPIRVTLFSEKSVVSLGDISRIGDCFFQ